MSRRVDTMEMLRRSLEGSALVGGNYGAALVGGMYGAAIDTYGKLKKTTERKTQARNAEQYALNPSKVAVFKTGKVPKGQKREYTLQQLSYKDYVDRLNSRKATKDINDTIVAREVKNAIIEAQQKNPNARRISGRDLLLIKYDVRNKTKLIKRQLKADGRAGEITEANLMNPSFRSSFGGRSGGGRSAGKMSEAEKEFRRKNRASIANRQMTETERSLELKKLNRGQKFNRLPSSGAPPSSRRPASSSSSAMPGSSGSSRSPPEERSPS